ncbi:hypothetical protein [Ornithinimicrobium cerasi]|uniref:Uncharacterized protein n=1 Tax=Ornithinimicrobium cerasi TaxID=2248773 RepID=A0A285VMM6_9MICO|nr:hypothetical protein [Ornithinimicrobium cerasi]SOC55319.1 hypothetical protein SAMN05421879_10524 [Ornithinimicrobium cerasi]
MTLAPDGQSKGGRAQPAERALRTIVASMALGLVLIGVVLVLIGAELLTPPLWMLLVVALATAGAWLLVVLSPVPTATAPGASTTAVVQPVVVMRTSLVEAPAILGLILAVVSDPMNVTVYVIPAMFALAGMWLFARPSVVQRRVEQERVLRQAGRRP